VKLGIRDLVIYENEGEFHELGHGNLTLRLGDRPWATKIMLEPCSFLLPIKRNDLALS